MSYGLTIAVYGHDGGGLRSDGSLDLVGVYATGALLNVYKHWTAAVPPDTVRSSHEAIGCGDDLAGDAQSLQGCEQRECAIGEQADIRYFQILS